MKGLVLFTSSHSNGYHGNHFMLGSLSKDKRSVVIKTLLRKIDLKKKSS